MTDAQPTVRLASSLPPEWTAGGCALTQGAVCLVRAGEARLQVNLRSWSLRAGSVFTLFPGDYVSVEQTTPTLSATCLVYAPDVLREASLQLERSIYDALREHCCVCERGVTLHASHMLRLLALLLPGASKQTAREQTTLQLRSYFLGFHAARHRLAGSDVAGTPAPRDASTGATTQLFHRFMALLDARHATTRLVADYAAALHVTPGHLSAVCRRHTGHSAKQLIDHVVTLRLEVALRQTTLSVKELAFRFHFASPTRLCQYFRSQTGYTPSAVRRSAPPRRRAAELGSRARGRRGPAEK